MWRAIDSAGLVWLLKGCEVNVARARITCARARKVDWRELRCVGRYPCKICSSKVGAVPVYDVPVEKRVRSAYRRRVSELEVQVTYIAEFVDEGLPKRFPEVAHERYVMSGTDLDEKPSLE